MKIPENQHEKAHHPIWKDVLPGSFSHQENPEAQHHGHVIPSLPFRVVPQGN